MNFNLILPNLHLLKTHQKRGIDWKFSLRKISEMKTKKCFANCIAWFTFLFIAVSRNDAVSFHFLAMRTSVKAARVQLIRYGQVILFKCYWANKKCVGFLRIINVVGTIFWLWKLILWASGAVKCRRTSTTLFHFRGQVMKVYNFKLF